MKSIKFIIVSPWRFFFFFGSLRIKIITLKLEKILQRDSVAISIAACRAMKTLFPGLYKDSVHL